MKVYLQGTFLLLIEFILFHREPLGLEDSWNRLCGKKKPKKRVEGGSVTLRPIVIDGLWLGGVV